MTSRLTALAALFAVLATATLTFAASAMHDGSAAATKQVRVVQLERVVIVGHRLPKASNVSAI